MNEALREQVAAAYGLDRRAAALLVGTTMHELEASAEKLVELLDRSGDREPESAGLFGDIAAAQADRKQALAALFAGAPQPRDEQGRFAPAGSFDGGARPQECRPETHEETLLPILRRAQAHRGGF
jgi:hypothetical protein